MDRLFVFIFICVCTAPLSAAAPARQPSSAPWPSGTDGTLQVFPWREAFDTSRSPLLPRGWTTTTAKAAAGDFTASSSSARSAPCAALATDARVAQCLVSPPISFAGMAVADLEFYERRSATFTAGLLVDASTRDDSASWFPITDTLVLAGASAYIRRVIPLPASLDDRSYVRFRWRTLGNGTGATGTLRIDDVAISVQHSVDLALDTLVQIPARVAAGDDVPLVVTVRNLAREGACTFTLTMIDSTLGGLTATDSTLTHFFSAADSCSVTLTYPRIDGGLHRVWMVLWAEGDEDTTNNLAAATLLVAPPAGAIVINEIMYEPAAHMPEYVELYNRSAATVDLAGWNMGDASGTQKNRATIPLPRSSLRLPASSMCVVASDSSILEWMRSDQSLHRDSWATTAAPAIGEPHLIVVPSLGLNNSGDDVLLFDPSGATADSVSYAPAWHTPKIATTGRALERINPLLPGADARNWGTSVGARGGTPGARNSIHAMSVPSSAALSLSPNPFSPNGDGIEDHLAIAYVLTSAAASLRVRIYDAAGRMVRTLANNEPAASSGAFLWNGRDDTNTRVRMGMYIVLVEAFDPRGGVLRAMKAVAVVATKLD